MKWKQLVWFVAFVVVGLVPAAAQAQAITSYELNAYQQGALATPVKTVLVAAVNVACTTGRATSPTQTWLKAGDALKFEFEPDDVRVCRGQLPASELTVFTPGTLYVMTAAAINEAGLKGGASPASNPFGVAGPPAPILKFVVLPSAGGGD